MCVSQRSCRRVACWTGRPKGVLLAHAGQLWALRTRLATYHQPAAERFLVAAPLYHMNALFSAKTALMTRASLVLLAGFTPESYIDATVRFRCTVLTSVPTMIARVVKDEARLAAADLGSVGRVTMGSAPTTPGVMGQGARRVSGGAAHHRLWHDRAWPLDLWPPPRWIADPRSRARLSATR